MQGNYSMSTLVVVVFTTGPDAIAKGLDNGQLTAIILVLTMAILRNV